MLEFIDKINIRKIREFLSHKIAPRSSRMAIRGRRKDIKKLIEEEGVENRSPILIDCGANDGGTIYTLLGLFSAPEIHAFEPLLGMVKKLRKKFQSSNNIHIYKNAVGRESKQINFYATKNKVSSSPLYPNEYNRKYHGEGVRTKEIKVKQIKLDDVVNQFESIDLLKMDLQGYELEALKGGSKNFG